MKLSLVFLCTSAVVLRAVVASQAPAPTQAPAESHLECSETSIPAYLKSVVVRNAVADLIAKLLKCLEKTANSATKTTMSIVKDVTSCVAKFPVDFFKCLAKADVPNKIAEVVNAAMETIKCVS